MRHYPYLTIVLIASISCSFPSPQNDTVSVEKQQPKSDIELQTNDSVVDYRKICSNRDSALISCEESSPDWTKEELKAHKNRRSADIKIDEINTINDSTIVVVASMAKNPTIYFGNISIEGDCITLYYWFDLSAPRIAAFKKMALKYTIRIDPAIEYTYKLKYITCEE